MTKILICSHGELAKGMVNSLEIIMGHQDKIDYLTFFANGINNLAEIKKYLANINSKDKLIILTDVFGGSVNQEVIKNTVDKDNVFVISGFNFPLLLELACKLNDDISEKELNDCVEKSKNQIIVMNSINQEFSDDFDF